MAYERQLREEMAVIDRGGRQRRTYTEMMVKFGEEYWPRLKPSAARRYSVSGRQLAPFFRNHHIDEIDRARIAEFISKRRREGASDSTIRRDLACLSSALSFAVQQDWIEHNVLKSLGKMGLKEAKPRVRWLKPKEYRRLLKAAGDLEPVIVVLVETGLRLGELLAARREDVDCDRRELYVHNTKSGMPRTVPLSETAVAQIRSQPIHLTCRHVFYNRRGCRHTVPAMSARLARAFRRAKLEDFCAHDLRHTFASWFLQRGGRIERLQRILGHQRIEQTMKYAHLATADLHEEIERVGTKTATSETKNRRK